MKFRYYISTVRLKLTTSRFNNVSGTSLSPRDLRGVAFSSNSDFVTVNDKLTILLFDGTVEATVDGVILEHVDHVFERNERVVDSNNLDVFTSQRGTEDNTTNTTETLKI